MIYDLSKVKFQMKVDELDVLKIYVGQEVKVIADALENVEMTGHITNISLEAITTGGVTEYPVTVEMDEVGDLLPGMNVSATIVLEEEKNALCIPVDALMRGNIVYVKNEEGQETDAEAIAAGVPSGFHEVTVEVGLSSSIMSFSFSIRDFFISEVIMVCKFRHYYWQNLDATCDFGK